MSGHSNRVRSTAASVLSLLLMLSSSDATLAGEVVGPNGEYRETHTDLSVKVLGGSVQLKRTWVNGRWYFNPAWADLRFTYDALDGSVKSIDRAGTLFERTEGGVFKSDGRSQVSPLRTAAGGSAVTGWRWTNTYGDWIEYDKDGRILVYGDRNDIRVSFERDAEQRIAQMKDHSGNVVLSWSYTNGKLSRVNDAQGRAVNYTWTGNNLTTVSDVLGHPWTYAYGGDGQVKSGTDPENHTWSLEYVATYPAPAVAASTGVAFTGAAGRDFRVSRVASFTNAKQETTRYEYDYNRTTRQWTVITVLPGTSRRVAEVYDVKSRLVRVEEGNTITFQRSRDGELVENLKDERGQVTRVERDSRRNVTRVTYPDGSSERWVYHPKFSFPIEQIDARGTRTTASYDARGNRLEMVEAAGRPEQRTRKFVWNALGQLESLVVKGASAVEDATLAFVYDGAGNARSFTDAEDVVRTYSHNAIGQVLTETDGRGKLWSWDYNGMGWPESLKDPLNHTRAATYDKVGNLKTLTDAKGRTTRYDYDALNRLVKVTDAKLGEYSVQFDSEGRVARQTDPNGQFMRFEYDARGRSWKVSDAAGNTEERVYGTPDNGLDGLVAAVQLPTYRVEYKYDNRDRPVQVVRVLSATQRETNSLSYDANGNLIATVDALGRATQYTYDKLDRLTDVLDPLGGRTHHVYDTRDNLVALTNANNQTHRFTWDRRDLIRSESRPMGESTQYVHDAEGNPLESTDARSQRGKAQYDDAGRLVGIEYFKAGVSLAGKIVSFEYDANDQLVGYRDQTTSAVYGYDELGRNVSEAVDYGAFSLGHSYEYYANGQIKRYTAPDGGSTNHVYDAAGRVQSVTLPSSGAIAFSNYEWNRAKTITFPGNTIRSQAFDALQRLSSATVKDAQNNILQDQSYEYDADGSITSRTTEHGRYAFNYDALNRLVSADYPNGISNDQINNSLANDTFAFPDDAFAYDLVGNRVSDNAQTGNASWIHNANNQLLDNALTSFSYNANGSPIEKKNGAGQLERRYDYNIEERLEAIRDANGQPIASYYHDPFGRRLWKTVSGGQPDNANATPKTTYLYYSQTGYDAELTLAGSHQPGDPNAPATSSASSGISVDPSANAPLFSQRYLFAPEGMWSTEPLAVWQSAANAAPGQSAGWRTTLIDQIGTPMGLVSQTGVVTQRSRANAFGATVGVGERQGLRFAGQIEDFEAGTHYNGFRDYDPSRGRYVQSDPVGFAGGINFYSYAFNSPQRHIDPTGESPLLAGIAVAAGIDLAAQLIRNGGDWDCVNWGSVAKAGAMGGLPLPKLGRTIGGFAPFAGKTLAYGRSVSHANPLYIARAEAANLPYYRGGQPYSRSHNLWQFFKHGVGGGRLRYVTPELPKPFRSVTGQEGVAFGAGRVTRTGLDNLPDAVQSYMGANPDCDCR